MRPVLSPAESLGLSGAALDGRLRRAARRIRLLLLCLKLRESGPEFVQIFL